MRKHATKSLLYDRLHKGIVTACIGLTIYGTVLFGELVYKYLAYVKPQLEASKLAMQQELLAEGADKESQDDS